MIVPDVNLLVYAYNADAPLHQRAKDWWEDALSRTERPVGLDWVVMLGFVRLMTHPAVLENPLRPEQATAPLAEWLAQPHVEVLQPGPRHLQIFESLLVGTGVAGNLSTDAHLAALAIEHKAELHSNDRDFGRFPGLRWRNPLSH